MATELLEVNVRGKYYLVPSLAVRGTHLIVNGKAVRLAVIYGEEWLESEITDPEDYIKHLRESTVNELKADVFTFSQKLPNTTPQYTYPMEWDSLAIIQLTSFNDWWEALPQETRKNTRRASKRGVVVGHYALDDKLIHDIMTMNNSSPPTRQGRAFDHYGKSLDQVRKDQASFPGRSDYICAYAGDELIGFIKIVHCGKTARIVQIITKDSAYDKRPGNALIVKLVEHCFDIKMEYLMYGAYAYGNKRSSSLLEFKKRHGFTEVLVPRYYVPLTLRGRLGMALNLHRDLVGILPERVIHFGLALRKKWYDFKAGGPE